MIKKVVQAGSAAATLAAGKIIPLSCKVTGTTVDGNNRWYLPSGGDNPEWESTRYLNNIGWHRTGASNSD